MGYGSSGEESNEGNSAAPMDSEVTTVAAPHSNDASGSSQAPAATMEAPMAMDNDENSCSDLSNCPLSCEDV